MTRIIVYNSLNNWWSYQLTLETYFRYNTLCEEIYWINIAEKNRKKYELNSNDYLYPLIYRDPIKNIERIGKKNGLNLIVNHLKLDKKNQDITFKDLNELKNFYIDDFNLGSLVFTQICGKLQTTNFDLKKNLQLINHYINLGISVYNKVIKDIKKIKPKKIFVINDRIINSAAAITAARTLGIEYKVIYWGSTPNKYMEYNESLYSFSHWKASINKNWLNIPNSKERTNSIVIEFKNRYSQLSADSKHFQDKVISGTAYTKKFDSKLAVFYPASEWEHSSIQEKRRGIDFFYDQYSSFTAVAEYLLNTGWEVVLKLHPSKKSMSSSIMQKEWKEFSNLPGVVVIEKDSDIDTYELIRQANINIVFRSTVGLECIARGLPLLVLGDTPWASNLQEGYASNIDEVKKYINEENYIIKPELIVPWYEYLKNFGDDFKYIQIHEFRPKYKEFEIISFRWYIKFFIILKKFYKNRLRKIAR